MTKTFEQLLEQFLQDTMNPEDLHQFLLEVKQPENAEALKGKLFQKLESGSYSGVADAKDMETKFQEMLERADRIRKDETKIIELYPGKKFLNIRRIAVAASIILALGLGSYFFFLNKDRSQGEEPMTVVPGDVKAPETNRAMITLANGQRVYLDSVGNGQLAVQGNVKLLKLANGQIAYQTAGGEIIKELQYNTLSNPRGSKVIDMTLADGSQVWLNAGSSITYPVAFVGDERKVAVNGEAYFEVAHNTAMPFKVVKGDVEVEVLGTHFNVNAYDDEADIKVTLLEGSVKVHKGKEVGLLKPGQQVQISNELKFAGTVDVDEVMAWKEGYFKFSRADIKTIMRQLARWYDLDVQYEGPVSQREFGGEMERDLPLSGMLRLLEKSNVHFKMDGKKIIVLP